MSISPNATLYAALVLYALGTIAALASLFYVDRRLQRAGLFAMIAGFVSHTIWIGTICTITKHPPLTNLPEAASFLAWSVFAVELVLLAMYRVQAASFFVYPLVFILLTLTAVVLWLFQHVANITDTLLIFLPKKVTHADHGQGEMYWYWSIVALLVAVFLIGVIGLFARNYFGKRIIQ